LPDRYQRLPGSARRYYDTVAKKEISRREYLTRKRGITPEEYAEQRAQPNIRASRLAEDFKTAEAKRLTEQTGKLVKPKDIKVRGKSESAERYKKAVKDLKTKDNSAGGRKVKALEILGRRLPEWFFPVGESPK